MFWVTSVKRSPSARSSRTSASCPALGAAWRTTPNRWRYQRQTSAGSIRNMAWVAISWGM